MKKLLIWLLLLPILSLAAEKRLNFVFIPKSSDQVFWSLMHEGVDKALEEQGNIKLTWRGPAHNDDTDSQIQILQAYAKPGVDAILIVPTDRVRLMAPIRAATEIGIKVIVVDSGLDGSWHTNMIATDNIRGGALAAQQMAKMLNKQGRILLLRTVASSASTEDRADGFIAYIKKNNPKIKVVADEYGGGATGKLHYTAIEMLKKHPDADGVFTVNETATEAMLRALREQGMVRKLQFIGFDSTDFLLGGVRVGEIQSLLIQNPRQMGYLAVRAAVAAVHNNPLRKKIIFTEVKLVTRENMTSPEIKKLMCVRC